MKVKQQTLTFTVALIAGLVGGVISSQLFSGQPAFFEKIPVHETVVRAERFEVVDSEGNVKCRLHGNVSGSLLAMYHDDESRFYVTVSEYATIALLSGPNPKEEGVVNLIAANDHAGVNVKYSDRVKQIMGASPTGSKLEHYVTGKVVWQAP
jgi:hypothetical protein